MPRRGLKTRTRSRRYGGTHRRAYKQRMRVSNRRKGYGRTSGYYGRFGPTSNAPELKFLDIAVQDAVVATTASILLDSMVKVPQGTTESTRIGRKCTLKSIGFRYHMTLAAATASNATTDTVRIIIYHDKQCNGAVAATTAILEDATDFQSFNNLANKNRFRTLMDRTHTLVCHSGSGRGSTDTLAFGEDLINEHFYKKCNIPIEYDSTAGAITEIRSNNIGILLIASTGVTGFVGQVRIRFSDN